MRSLQYGIRQSISKAPNGNPSALAVVSNSDVQQTLSWNNNATNHDGAYIYRSTNGGISFALYHTLNSQAETYSPNDLTASQTYYWYIVLFKGSKTSLPSNTVNDSTYPVGFVASTDKYCLDGVIIDIAGTKYFKDKTPNARNFPIANYDFKVGTVGFPYKSKATISAPAGDTDLIAWDTDKFWYDSTNTPRQIPVQFLFQDIHYSHKLFHRHLGRIVDTNGVEDFEPRVSIMAGYANPKTGSGLTSCNNYYSVPTEVLTAKWIAEAPTGSDSADGSKATPYATPTKAETLTAGKTFYIKSGVFSGDFSIAKGNTWIATGYVEFKAVTNYAVLTSTTSTLSMSGIGFNGNGKQSAVKLFSTSKNKAFNKCLFYGAASYEINNEGSTDNSYVELSSCLINSTATNWMRVNAGVVMNGCRVYYDKTGGYGMASINTAVSQFNVQYCESSGNCERLYDFPTEKFYLTYKFNTGSGTSNHYSITKAKSLDFSYNFIDTTGSPFTLSPQNNFVIRSYNNRLNNRSKTGYHISIGSETTGVYNDILTDCIIENNNCFGAIYYDSSISGINETTVHGIFIGHQKNVTVRYNSVYGAGIGYIKKHSSGTDDAGGFYGNLAENCVVSFYIKGQNNVNIYNNTSINTLIGADSLGHKALRIGANGETNYSTGIKLKNNVFVNTVANKSDAALICIDEVNSTLTSDNNNLYCVDRLALVGGYGGTLYSNLTAWKAAGYDANSIDSNPNLTNMIPAQAITGGADLGANFQSLLDTTTDWTSIIPKIVNRTQGSSKQIGAYIIT